MSDTKIIYELREYRESGKYVVRQTGASESELRVAGERMAADEPREFKIAAVITTESILDIFTVPAIVYSLEDIAEELSDVYAGSVDWSNEHYLRLSAEDKETVKSMMDTDSCDNCGWEFNNSYLSYTEHGHICDHCESDIAEEEESEDDDES